jgi:hypothetical protein
MKKIQHEKNSPIFDHNLCQELASLAEKMKFDCYSGEKNSKEIKLNFRIGIADIWSKIHEYS